MRDLSSGCKPSFFRLKILFAPYSEEIEPALLGMSLTTRRGTSTQISFLVFESRSCENFVLAQFSIGWSENWQLNKTRALFDQLFLFLARKLKNELLTVVVWKSRNCDSREAENWSGYLSDIMVLRLIPRRAGSTSSLCGAKTTVCNNKQKISFCNLKKQVPHNKRP